MSKTITLRLDDSTYNILRMAAEGERRTISNFIEFAAVNYTLNDLFVSDEEMEEMKGIFPGLRKGLKDAKEGKYTIVK
jgi:predicted transcriptional regulator